jgi:hypothetical protein
MFKLYVHMCCKSIWDKIKEHIENKLGTYVEQNPKKH